MTLSTQPGRTDGPKPVSSAETTISAAGELAHSWRLKNAAGLTVFVPDRLNSITAYVMLEQERWFEHEIDFVQRLVGPESNVLDIGANHGVYSLALASHLVDGRVWAFEPTSDPRARLQASVNANDFQHKITVMPIGLSDSRREVEFSISPNSELNSRHATSTVHETVLLDTLDAFAATHLEGRQIGFVKLDAEGEEPQVLTGGSQFFTQQSPVVMFELQHGGQVNLPLIDRFRAFGFDVFHHLPELDMLVPFKPDAGSQHFMLNLFAVKPDRQATLAAARLLVRAADLAATSPGTAPDAAAMAAWEARMGAAGITGLTSLPADAPFRRAFDDVIAAHFSPSASAAERFARVTRARDGLRAHLQSGEQVSREELLLLVHALNACGDQMTAVTHARHLLEHWPDFYQPALPVIPPSARDAGRTHVAAIGSWIRYGLEEFIETHRHYSSYYAACDLPVMVRLLAHPDHGAEMERRYALHMLRNGQAPDAALVPELLTPARSVNGALLGRLIGDVAAANGSKPA